MCRHLAYLGPPVRLSELLLDPPHSLLRQSFAPADMRGSGTVNADGYGVGWFPEIPVEPGFDPSGGLTESAGRQPATGKTAGAESSGGGPGGWAVRYRRAVPIWTDAALPDLLSSTRSGAVLAAVRNATVGMPVVDTACAPFTDGSWLFSHNGRLDGWPDSAVGMARRLPVTDLLTLDAPTDAALLWALVRRRLRAGDGPADALAAVVTEAAAAAPDSSLNLLLTDGQSIAATAWSHALSVRRTPDSTTVSSEPWDDGAGWQPVPDRHLLLATRTTVDIRPMKGQP